MAIAVWTPSPSMSPIQFTGHIEFRDTVIPLPGKDEWGVDTLERTVQGPGSHVEDFYKTLKQGATFKYAGINFFLQSWRPIEHRCFPGALISYKGLIGDALPNPIPFTSYDECMSVLTASDLEITIGSEEDGTERIITGGTREIKYLSPTTTWKYINRGEPRVQKFRNVPGNVRATLGIVNRSSVIFAQFEDGGSQRYVGSAPAGLATALFATPYVDIIGPTFFPIIGTPFFECEEVCQYRYPDS